MVVKLRKPSGPCQFAGKSSGVWGDHVNENLESRSRFRLRLRGDFKEIRISTKIYPAHICLTDTTSAIADCRPASERGTAAV